MSSLILYRKVENGLQEQKKKKNRGENVKIQINRSENDDIILI